jgi:hypothetical protein
MEVVKGVETKKKPKFSRGLGDPPFLRVGKPFSRGDAFFSESHRKSCQVFFRGEHALSEFIERP